MKLSAVLILVGALATSAYGQRPRTMEPEKNDPAKSTPATPSAPQTFKAKYEGGIIGYTKKQDGTLTFDDTNRRLLFRDKQQKELLFIPYDAVIAAYPDTKSRRPTAATVASAIPVPYGLNLPAAFIKKKFRYLTLNFDDPDTNVSGLTSFKVESKELLTSVLNTLAAKADLTQRGEGYIRKKNTAKSSTGP
jgi:hypothetical protein